MKPSHTDHPRRSPVALRWKRSPVPEFAVLLLAICWLYHSLSAGQYEPFDLALAVQVHHRAHELPLLVGASRVYAQRASDPGVAPCLVYVLVQREGRLALLYRFLDRL